MTRISLCDGWQFAPQWTDELVKKTHLNIPIDIPDPLSLELVRLPHTCAELPLHYLDPEKYQMVCGYFKVVTIPQADEGSHFFLRFDGAAHHATIFVNGEEAAHHHGGYTSFSVDVTKWATISPQIAVAVRLDTRETLNQPPFGHVIDYLTYGGLYREVWLDIKNPTYIADVFAFTPTLDCLETQIKLANLTEAATVQLRLLDSNNDEVDQTQLQIDTPQSIEAAGLTKISMKLPGLRPHPWTPEDPYLYRLQVTLTQGDQTVDCQSFPVGFRTCEFRADGFYLNGRKYKIRGLNRHQSYAHVGYAMPASIQQFDAKILKEELQVNAVRTSHYPQSQHFLDACDRLGLLVFTEIPGWQHIGDESWKQHAIQNTREMVSQYRNHPSIVLWGVRINESQDDSEFYRRTNQVAKELDSTRQTGGVRFIWNSDPVEDVYGFNDFSMDQGNRGLLPRRLVAPKKEVPYLVTEFNGHMFPTKSFDPPLNRLRQALRYANVLDAVQSRIDIAGSFGWCMADYQTHNDFGSGDGICYHGVLDIFRNPKLAAAVYASAGRKPMLQVASSMDIGDYPGSRISENYAFTNAEEVRVYLNDQLIEIVPARSKQWPHLAHPPLRLDDTIGDKMERGENFSSEKAEALKKSFFAVRQYGQYSLPPAEVAKTAWRLFRHRVSVGQAVELYTTYLHSWGDSAPHYRFDAVNDGQVVARVERGGNRQLSLAVEVSHCSLVESTTYDVAAVRIRVTDSYGNTCSYAQVPVTLEISGVAELIGPTVVTAEGGMTGTYVRSVGAEGDAKLKISIDQAQPVEVDFSVSVKNAVDMEHLLADATRLDSQVD